jgi:hypothetical protein
MNLKIFIWLFDEFGLVDGNFPAVEPDDGTWPKFFVRDAMATFAVRRAGQIFLARRKFLPAQGFAFAGADVDPQPRVFDSGCLDDERGHCARIHITLPPDFSESRGSLVRWLRVCSQWLDCFALL